MQPIHILGIAGSLRRASWNAGLLRAAAELLPAGVTLKVFDLAPLPFYNQDLDNPEQIPAAARELREQVRAADALLFATPEYNHSLPAVLKNAIDWASRPIKDSALNGTPGAILGAGGMFGTVRAQQHLRQVLNATGVHVLSRPEVLVTRSWEKFDAEGNLTDDATREQIAAQLAALVAWTRRLRGE